MRHASDSMYRLQYKSVFWTNYTSRLSCYKLPLHREDFSSASSRKVLYQLSFVGFS